MSTHEGAKALFLAALERAPGDRPAFLAAACGDDSRLRQEVESLLAFHEAESSAPGTEAPVDAGAGGRAAFVPGFLFAGRYRIVALLGRGGMGEVWRADDLTLGTPVALKLIRSPSRASRERLLAEVRLARQITHPAVCRVFDIGQTDDEFFFSMELVEGQDLATVLHQAGRLAPERVVEIARQICHGLAAAHAVGVLHRDLKPANLLIGQDGRVRITDFGIAIPTDDIAPPVAGTPRFMSPEQRAGGRLTPQTDLYALGVVLYVLATGRYPFVDDAASADVAEPSSIVSGLDAGLERAILAALAPSPADRPRSAAAMADMLPTTDNSTSTPPMRPASTPGSPRRWRVALAALGLSAAAVGIAVVLLTSRTPAALTAQDTIVLADFENATNEPLFDGTLKVALAVALEQSPFLRVFPDERVRETLRLMEQPTTTRLTSALAREVAVREHLKATLAGSITPLGTRFVIALEALDAASGDVIAREQVQADGTEQVLAALGDAATRLRKRLGESLASLQQFDVPLARATTESLGALHSYSRALEGGRMSVRIGSIPHLQRAIELDPDFALAQAVLSGVYANVGRISEAPVHARRAFELRDRVSERERYFIAWRYYRDALQDWQQALDLARAWTMAYPREPFAFNSLGIMALGYGFRSEGLAALRQGMRLDPKFVSPYINLGDALLGAGQVAEAKALVAQAHEVGIEFVAISRLTYLIALMENDAAGMASALEVARATPEAIDTENWTARVSAMTGHLAAAHAEFARGVVRAEQTDLHEWAARFTVEDALAHALLERCDEVPPATATALRFSRNSATLDMASRVLAWCGQAAASSALDAELASRFPTATMRVRLSLPLNAAARAIRTGSARLALNELQRAEPLDGSTEADLWPSFLRGQALLAIGDGAGAATAFQAAIDRRGEAPDSLLYPLSLLGRARAAVAAGDVATAGAVYRTLDMLWRDADADLAPVEASRRELARLR